MTSCFAIKEKLLEIWQQYTESKTRISKDAHLKMGQSHEVQGKRLPIVV